MASINRYKLNSGETRWRVRYRTPDNRQTDKSGFRSKAHAEAWRAQMEVSKQQHTFVSTTAMKTPVGKLIEHHIAQSAGLARSTREQRQSHGKNWVLPKWQNWPVGNVNRASVEQWIEEMIQANAKPDTVRKAHQMLVTILNRAVEDGLIPRNPARGVRLPKTVSKRHPYLTFDEVAELALAIDPRYRLLVIVLSLTGLRFGEAAALRTSSINLDARLISVDETVTEVGGEIAFGPPKSHERRTVAFPDILDSELRELVESKPHDALLFTSPRGDVLRHVSWKRRFWHPALDSVNLARRERSDAAGAHHRPFPKVTPHDLRHTAASLAVRDGASAVGVQRMLGHADAKITLNTYVDLFTSDLTAVAAVLSRSASASSLHGAIRHGE